MSTISKTEGVAALAEVLRSEDQVIAVKRSEYRAMLATFAVSLMVLGCLVIALALMASCGTSGIPVPPVPF
jgi:hypothetical protein